MRLSNPNKKIKPTTKMETNKMKTILSTLSIALIAILPHAAQASTVTIAANGANVSGVGNSRFFTSSLTSQVLDLGDQIRVGFFSSSSLSAVVSNWNSGSYANLSALSTALNAIFTPIGETGFPGTSTGGKVTINDKQNLATVDGAISFNITALDPVSSGHGGKQIYLWATDDATWSSATALAVVTDATWIVPSANASNVTVNTAYINLASSAELILGGSGPIVSGVNSISLIPEPSSASLLALGVAGLVALRVRRKS
jgi:hypothetical protein